MKFVPAEAPVIGKESDMFKTSGTIGMAIAVALVTGCSAVIVNESPGPRASYFDGDFEYAVQKGSVVAVIAGNPFNIPKNRFDTAVRQAIRGDICSVDRQVPELR